MNKLIIDATNKSIFLMIITNDSTYNVTHENSKTPFLVSQKPKKWGFLFAINYRYSSITICFC